MKIVIPMSGMSSRFSSAGYQLPKYLLEVDGKTVIQHIVELYPRESDFIFIVNDKNAADTNVIEVLDGFDLPNAQITQPSHSV